MPVLFKGKIPKVGSNITIYGQVQNVNGSYIFEGRAIK
jgi:hypothetical protein